MHGILCFGDSITFGICENGGWVGELREYFEPKGGHNAVYNLGICGDRIRDLLERFEVECDARIKEIYKEDKFVIIVAIGINDSKWKASPEKNNPETNLSDFSKNLELLIKKARKFPAKLVFIGLTPVDEEKTLNYEGTSFVNERIKEFNDIIRNKCNAEDILFFDMFKEMINGKYQGDLIDGLHPNNKGYKFMFGKIKGFLEKENLI